MDKNLSDNLAELLQKSQATITAEEARRIIAGVAASPIDEGTIGEPGAWISLIAENPGANLTACLNQELENILKSGNGLSPQSFIDFPAKERLTALRAELSNQGLWGFIVPLSDEHQGEYVPKSAQRLAWLTGFTGSAGLAIVLADKAALFVDGRYTLQAADQVDGDLYEISHLTDSPPGKWILKHLPKNSKLGFDPWLHTVDGATRLRLAAKNAGGALTAILDNPIDKVWRDQPPPPITPITLHPVELTGQSSADKRAQIAKILKESGQEAVVLTAPDAIAWLANIRGGDVPYTPLALSFAILHRDEHLDIYIDRRKVRSSVKTGLDAAIRIHDRDEFNAGLTALGETKQNVRLDKSSAAEAVSAHLIEAGATISAAEDPCQPPKSIKNNIELSGIRNAHVRDGAALTRFLAWLGAHQSPGDLTEIDVADKLDGLRAKENNFRGLSFPTISAAGPSGAIVHYRAQKESARTLESGSLYLVDSGGQYLDGTTDVTRTIAIGEPSAEMRTHFTRVLKGHIALAMAIFPKGTAGSQLDILARKSLWQAGLDYDHGTGHGVGNYLGVHEGPQRISKIPNRVALEPGMIISNEPGYYKTGAYGIRIENLVVVKETTNPNNVLCFETLTLAPIDRNLIEESLLTKDEADWLNDYHKNVAEILRPMLDEEAAKWLDIATRPVNFGGSNGLDK